MKNRILLFILLFVTAIGQSQVTGNPTSFQGGVKPTRIVPYGLTTTQKNAIASPTNGTKVYDVTLGRWEMYNGTAWVPDGGGGNGIEVKTTAEREAIADPANGRVIYDSDLKSLTWYDLPSESWKVTDFAEIFRNGGGVGYVEGVDGDGNSVAVYINTNDPDDAMNFEVSKDNISHKFQLTSVGAELTTQDAANNKSGTVGAGMGKAFMQQTDLATGKRLKLRLEETSTEDVTVTVPAPPVEGDYDVLTTAGTMEGRPIVGNIALDYSGIEIGNLEGYIKFGLGVMSFKNALDYSFDSFGSENTILISPHFSGIIANTYYGEDSGFNDNSFTQKKYVDDAIAAAGGGGGGTVTEVTGTDGVTIASGTTTPVVGLGDITPDSVSATGNVTGANLSGTNTGDETAASIGDLINASTFDNVFTGSEKMPFTDGGALKHINSSSFSDFMAEQFGLAALQTAIDDLQEDKVDKVTGKGLSTEDYTTAEKNKLAAIPQLFRSLNTTVTSPVTATTSATPLYSILIPSNTFAVGDMFAFRSLIVKSGVVNGGSITLYVGNTANAMTTSLGVCTNANNVLYAPFQRTFIVRSGNQLEGFAHNWSGANDDELFGQPTSLRAFTPTIDQYLTIAVTPTSSNADTWTGRSASVLQK